VFPTVRDGSLLSVRGGPKCRTAVFGQDAGPYRVRHFSSGQGGGRRGMARDGGGRQGTIEDGRERVRTARYCGGLRGTAGDGRRLQE